jgi:mono/diheme cytochrome c family protein
VRAALEDVSVPSLRSLFGAAAHALAGACAERAASREAPVEPAAPRFAAPKIWDAEQLADWATPLAGLGLPPTYASEAEYYAAPVDNLRTYPVYHPRHEPPGYREELVRRGPQPLIEPGKLRTQAEWVEAGRRVFAELDLAASRTDDASVLAHFTSAESIDAHRDEFSDPLTRDGVILEYRWVVDHDGKLKISLSNCSSCHTRLMPDRSVLDGAPSNYDLSEAPAATVLIDRLGNRSGMSAGADFYAEWGVPWLADDPHARFRTMSDDEVLAFRAQESGEPLGTMFARFNGSLLYSTRHADLRGIRDRRWLDATGTHKNRGPEDVARYGILVEYADQGVFGEHRMLEEAEMRIERRPPDDAMYAMAVYLYSLEPAPSPHAFDELAQRGSVVFDEQGCFECHPPPHYTDNELVAPARVGTDPGQAFATRKGTGRYKVPSLRGLWYRGLYEHSGSVASLEDWFDPRRLQPDYVPSGWRGKGVRTRAVPGHEYGLDLQEGEKRALIAFLMTL